MTGSSGNGDQGRGSSLAPAGREALERELYWAAEPRSLEEMRETDLPAAWADLLERLQLQQATGLLHPTLSTGSRLRRFVKRVMFRLLRPATRRSAEIELELAELGELTARRLQDGLTSLEWAMGPLMSNMAEMRMRHAAALGHGAPVADEFYWRFETFMRGDPAQVAEKLRQYETRVRSHIAYGRSEPPLWLDLGCGRGEFALLLQEWGCQARGVDISAEAIDACRLAGVDAVQADAVTYIENYDDEQPTGISALQLIEHLPREAWGPFLRSALAALQPGGALLLETINPLNVRALAGSFFADPSHSWPAHPHTLRLMAETVGFSTTELLWINPDDQGEPQDYALWAVK
jgi:SAM-dependent methyltransferase